MVYSFGWKILLYDKVINQRLLLTNILLTQHTNVIYHDISIAASKSHQYPIPRGRILEFIAFEECAGIQRGRGTA